MNTYSGASVSASTSFWNPIPESGSSTEQDTSLSTSPNTGGKATKSGLGFEELTNLGSEYTVLSKHKYFRTIQFGSFGQTKVFTTTTNLFKCMSGTRTSGTRTIGPDKVIGPQTREESKTENKEVVVHGGMDTNVPRAHGCKNPDECYIDEEDKKIFIIEKKCQQVRGSVCEKIQTSDFKVWQYSRTFPGYKVVYIYCLSDWFKENCKAELEYLAFKGVPVFWGNDVEYKRKIVYFISSGAVSDNYYLRF